MWRITKEFGCDYGHRVWSQTLDTKFSIDGCLVCRHLHGHRMTVLVELEAEKLNQGMVTDFKHLNWFKQWLDDVVDHKFVIDINDPLFERITGFSPSRSAEFTWYDDGYAIIPLTHEQAALENEFRESFVIVDFVPTSENLSAWFHKIIQARMDKMGIKVSKVTFYETPKSKSEYLA